MRNLIYTILGIALLIGNTAEAQPVSIFVELDDSSAPVIVDSVETTISSGMTFRLNLDTTTADIWAPTDFGLFPALSAFLTAPDLGLFNEEIVTPLAYFEDDSPDQRAGVGEIFPNSGIDVGLPGPGQTFIGDPNSIDVLPDFSGDPNHSKWSGGQLGNPFSFQTAGGLTITNAPLGDDVSLTFGSSRIYASVPEPSVLGLLIIGFAAIGFMRRSGSHKY